MKTTVVTRVEDLEAVANDWDELLKRSETNEPSVSPAWMLTWWRAFGALDGRDLSTVLFHDGGRLVGIAPLLRRVHRYRPGLPFHRIELLGTGEAEADEICSEYVGVVAERGAEQSVANALAAMLSRGIVGAWDEIVLSAMNGATLLPLLLSRALEAEGTAARIEVTSAAPYIPLPSDWDAYLAALPSSRRYMIRRSLREFESWAGAEARWERPSSREDLASGLTILERLHGERWADADDPGVFASARFRAFHADVMPRLFDRGALDLSWLTVRGEPIAAMYNVVWRDKTYFYQGGRKPDLPKALRVGIVMHAHAIRAAIERGAREYDFLSGTSRYKLDLALATHPIVRLRAARHSMVEAARRAAELVVDHARALSLSARRLRSAEM